LGQAKWKGFSTKGSQPEEKNVRKTGGREKGAKQEVKMSEVGGNRRPIFQPRENHGVKPR